MFRPAIVDGQPYKATRFTPLAKVEDGQIVSTDRSAPYGLLTLEAKGRGSEPVCAVTHKVDFGHLWAAFVERGIGVDETAVVTWSKKHLKVSAKLFSPFMPRLAVMIFKNAAYELFIDPNSHPELRGEARLVSELPIMRWQPDVWSDRIVPTRREYELEISGR